MNTVKQKKYVYLAILVAVCLFLTSAAAFFCSNDMQAEAAASGAIKIGNGKELWQSGIGKFNDDVFYDLTEKLFGNKNWSDYVKTETDAQTGSYVISANTINSNIQQKNSNGVGFKTISNSAGLVVKLGSLDWMVASLTLAEGSGDVVATLYLADDKGTSQYYSDHSNVKGNNMYSSSILRSNLLSDPDFALFTGGSFANNFLVQPNNIKYQLYQTFVGRDSGLSNFNLPNEALRDPTNGQWKPSTGYQPGDTFTVGGREFKYEDWGEDYIWIPSASETGWNDYASMTSIWKLSSSQRAHSGNAFSRLRSGLNDNYGYAYSTDASGNSTFGEVTNSPGVRPAIHLNLSKAEEAATVSEISVKGNVKQYYSETGGVANDTTFELANVIENKVQIAIDAVGVNGASVAKPEYTVTEKVLSFNVSVAGEYTVKVTPKDGECWIDGTRTEKKFTFKLKHHVAPLELDVINPENIVYNGQDQYLPLRYYEEDLMQVKINNIDEPVINDGKSCIKVKEAKTYAVKVELKDKNLMEWTDNDGTESRSNINVTIKKKILKLTAKEMLWTTSVKTQKEYLIGVEGICGADIDKVEFEAYVKDPDGKESKLSALPTLNADNTEMTAKLPAVDKVGDGYKYILRLNSSAATSRNYSLEFEQEFKVETASLNIDESEIKWTYGNADINNGQPTTVSDADINGAGVLELQYNSKEYVFNVDSIYKDANAYPSITTQIQGDVKKTDANASGYYTIVFEIKAADENIKLTGKTRYELNWKINKAKYNLNDVKWERKRSSDVYDGANHEVYLTGLPSTLKATYGGEYKKIEAKDGYIARVVQIENVDVNYEDIDIEDKTTYEYNNGQEFDWEYSWDIKKAGITLSWVGKLAEDKNGKDFEYYVVSGEYADKIKEYEYYNGEDYSLSTGAKGDKIAFEDIEVKSPVIMSYWAVALLSDEMSKNYEITGNKAKYFSIGSDKIEVAVELNAGDYDYTYDRMPHGSELTLTGTTLPIQTLLRIKFVQILQDVETDLASAPTDAGRYAILIELAEGYEETYELIRTRIEFEISKAKVTVERTNAEAIVYNGKEQTLELQVTCGDVSLEDIVQTYFDAQATQIAPVNAGAYYIELALDGEVAKNYELETVRIDFQIEKIKLSVKTEEEIIIYDGEEHGAIIAIDGEKIDKEKISIKYYRGEVSTENELASGEKPKNAGKYIVVYGLADEDVINYEIVDGVQSEINIDKKKIAAVWDKNSDGTPIIYNLSESDREKIGYKYYDEQGTELEEGTKFEKGKKYSVKAVFLGEHGENYAFVDEHGVVIDGDGIETQQQEFVISAGNNDNTKDEQVENQFDKAIETFKNWWQVIASGASILLILTFTAKGISYAGKKKENKKTIEKKYKTYYAISGIGLFELSLKNWTIIAGALMGAALLSLIFMLIEKKGYKKSLRELEDAKDEYNKTMFMNMSGQGVMGQQGYAYAQQPAIGMEDMRVMINDAVSAMLPNVQQYLPQQASGNDEMIQRLQEQNEKNEERIRHLTQRNEERIEELMRQLSEQKAAEKEVASAKVNDALLKELNDTLKSMQEQINASEKEKEFLLSEKNRNEEKVSQLNKAMEDLKETVKNLSVGGGATETSAREYDRNSDKIETLMRNQEILMQRMSDLAINAALSRQSAPQQPAPQIVERIIEKPVERIVEKEVVKEMPSEAEKAPDIPDEKKSKSVAPRLNLDEAYEKLSAKQKKYFDTIKQYAMSKDKCKERKSAYYVLLGQSSVNPLVKLTIKKGVTVALFKMEDEYFKDIRRNAGSDGTKMKVKETELVVGDAQALATAKEMIDLREDQIERYNDYLKEQRAMKKR